MRRLYFVILGLVLVGILILASSKLTLDATHEVLRPLADPPPASEAKTTQTRFVDDIFEPPKRSEVPAGRDQRRNFELTGTCWICGTVVYPTGTPPDEDVTVYATLRRPLGVQLDAQSFDGMLASAEPTATCDVAPDGSFELPYPTKVGRCLLLLLGHYLHLPDTEIVRLPAKDPLVLEPVLGAWWTGRLLLPQDLPPDIDPAALVGAMVHLHPSQIDALGYERNVTVGPDLWFSIVAIPPNRKATYVAWVETQDFAHTELSLWGRNS
jgi:hypothetical protein